MNKFNNWTTLRLYNQIISGLERAVRVCFAVKFRVRILYLTVEDDKSVGRVVRFLIDIYIYIYIKTESRTTTNELYTYYIIRSDMTVIKMLVTS